MLRVERILVAQCVLFRHGSAIYLVSWQFCHNHGDERENAQPAPESTKDASLCECVPGLYPLFDCLWFLPLGSCPIRTRVVRHGTYFLLSTTLLTPEWATLTYTRNRSRKENDHANGTSDKKVVQHKKPPTMRWSVAQLTPPRPMCPHYRPGIIVSTNKIPMLLVNVNWII